MAFSDIPQRLNGVDQLIDASWFNTIKSELVSAFGSGGYIAVEPGQDVSSLGELTYSATSFKPLLQVQGDGGAVTTSSTPFGTSHGFTDGKEIVVIGLSDTNTVTIPENDITDGVVNAGGGDITLERYSYVLFIYNATLERFIATTSGGSSGIGTHENLGSGDGVSVGFSLSSLPLTDDSFIVFRNGSYVPSSQYSFSNPTITFNTAPSVGQRIDVWILTTGSPSTAVATGVEYVEYPTLTGTDITNKNISLSATPLDPAKVKLDVISGSSQQYSVDYTVSGSTLDWDGLGLDGSLTNGDVLRIVYFA